MYRPRCGWYLITSGEARRELRVDWTEAIIWDCDLDSDAPTEAAIEAKAAELMERYRLRVKDSRHLARAVLRSWVGAFVSSDAAFRRVKGDPPRPGLEILSVIEAAEALQIAPGELPPTCPVWSTPTSEDWWVPPAVSSPL